MKALGLISFGALIGAILSFAATEISSWRRRREEKKEKTIDIITDTVKFVTTANERINDVECNLADCDLRITAGSPMGASEAEKEKDALLKNPWVHSADFFDTLNFHSFQLKRLSNQDTLKVFENLMHAYRVLFDTFYVDLNLESKEELEYRKLYKNFIKHCIEISKINVPKRTLSAPAKKKGASRKS